MRKVIFIALIAVVSLSSCTTLKNPGTGKTYTTEEGLQITFFELGDGPQADSGDVVAMHYIGKLENDSIFGSSYQRNQPFQFRTGKNQVIKGWEIAVKNMHEGDSALLVIPPDLAYGDEPRGPIPASSTLRFMVKLIDVKKAPKPFDTANVSRLELDNELIIYKVKDGTGKKLEDGDFVEVHYTGYFKNGEIFDSSVEREQPVVVQLGENQVIKGWEHALKNMSVGDKARVIIPPELAYGEKGYRDIEPNTTIIMDIEVLGAKKPQKAVPYDVAGKDTVFTKTGLGIIKVKETQNKQAAAGDFVKVHYTGYFENGEIFDSSVEAGKPISFQLGRGQVIKGWDEGLQQLREGEKARLIIPYQLAYGEKGSGPIPPKSKLIFDVHLLNIRE